MDDGDTGANNGEDHGGDHAGDRGGTAKALPVHRPASVVLASNRGPLAYSLTDDGTLIASRGGGGLVSGLAGAADALWICAALTPADRRAARSAADGRLEPDDAGPAVRMLDIDAATFARAYGTIANSTLWFLHHMLYDVPNHPWFGSRFERDWHAYQSYNAAFANAIAQDAARHGQVLVQDYHLTLAPAMLRKLRPDLRIGHFSHTPWAPPQYFRLLPDGIATEVLEGVLGADRAGFHTRRWAEAFARCCLDVLGAEVTGLGGGGPLSVRHRGDVTVLAAYPLGVDPDGLRERASRPDVVARVKTLEEQLGGRLAIVRIDRTELSKNIVRGLRAYRELLDRHPEWRDRVVHVVFAYPSRHDLPVYREYTAQVQRVAQEINEEFGTDSWEPVLLGVNDDYARSLAAYRLADVLLVNPLRDGMNLVAKEGPVLAEHGCALVLSREAGAADELGAESLLVNPFDILQTAEALHQALGLDADERRRRSARLVERATALPPAQWLERQLGDLVG
jgi:trehalose 6-phosphate synthase